MRLRRIGRVWFRLAARWNRLGEAVKTRKKRDKTGKRWARYGLKRRVGFGLVENVEKMEVKTRKKREKRGKNGRDTA